MADDREREREWEVGVAGGLGGTHRFLPQEQHDQEENPQTVSPANSMSNAWLSDRPTTHTHTHTCKRAHTYTHTATHMRASSHRNAQNTIKRKSKKLEPIRCHEINMVRY